MKKLYCGGTFSFDYKESDYLEKASEDYRAKLLGSCDRLLNKSNGEVINDNVTYIGPFYFESDGMLDEEIVASEVGMIEECTDTIFLLDDARCPGTIGELILATTLNKDIAIFYIEKGLDEETESNLHTPCWFPILMSKIKNKNTKLFSCKNREEAVNMILDYVNNKM